jgi:hypothetical protein
VITGAVLAAAGPDDLQKRLVPALAVGSSVGAAALGGEVTWAEAASELAESPAAGEPVRSPDNHDSGMAIAESVPADSESPPSDDASSRDGARSRDIGGRAAALIVGVLVGMGIGLGIGMGLGSAARKRLDRWSFQY